MLPKSENPSLVLSLAPAPSVLLALSGLSFQPHRWIHPSTLPTLVVFGQPHCPLMARGSSLAESVVVGSCRALPLHPRGSLSHAEALEGTSLPGQVAPRLVG